ncbi:MAG TPA: DUF4097 family beta strand repeat-containing protein [Granulicella sp.]|jgi:DUF4097 and DUF4098 domain-containing protein YvlB|nr:DUF4097 family beta strand repeat-containing protein [Granulicella sp.]
MAGYPPPYPPPPGSPYGASQPPGPPDWRNQQRVLREQAKAMRYQARLQRDAYRAQYRGMRRGSIVGPLLLIAIGVLFLLIQTGRLPYTEFWDWYGRWWPLLLIGVGTIVLLEWILDQVFHHDDRPYVRRGIGGGVIALLILLGIAGVTLNGVHDGARGFFLHNFSLNQDDLDQFLGDKHESDQTVLQPLPAGGSFEVDNPHGDVTISGTSDDNQIHVVLHKEVYSRSDSDAANKAQQLSPNLTTNGSNVQLRLPSLEGARADLTITVPANAPQTVVANHGDVHVSAIKAPVTVTANHGDVEISAITGKVTTHIHNSGSSFSIHSTTGEVSLQGRGGDVTFSEINGPINMQGDFFGSTHLEHIRGAVRFHTSRTDFQLARLDGEIDISPDQELSADEALGPVILNTRDRNITLERIAGDVSVINRNGTVNLTSAPPLGNVTVENRNGSVHLTLPEQASFNVHAETTDGSLSNDFNLPVLDTSHVNSMSGSAGQGGPSIKITTSQGDIALKKASIAPLPPPPPPPPPLTDVPPSARRAIKDAQQAAKDAARRAKKAADDAKDSVH